ncbi:Rieske 2Fe-2S domain-containing protein [Gluconacetobacter sacchari]|uniref:Rieske 2Fe-2S domain-containing protein n=3 Tax=Gluconacetobacter sacchari TaxID=92759 RepID=A0A7W4ICE8_9PROT|nr:Rieske 2Fe-2S domain-containing protein [Gluconacetobacter sacchari]MBB2160265.1 Rieske 2Fe-2S domain-containing protein [Gluconacetobacter sacchari]GBQ28801.1 hypothetical protein AA12717_3062 [Gluconacetobacter sacchari DSM 12717]
MENWVRLCATEAARAGPHRVVVDGTGLVVWLAAGGRPRVFADRCPHRDARLSAGYVEAGHLVCPFHLWAFDESGHYVGPDGVAVPECAVARFPVRECDGALWVRLAPAPAMS